MCEVVCTFDIFAQLVNLRGFASIDISVFNKLCIFFMEPI